jgi:IS30 family transposase
VTVREAFEAALRVYPSGLLKTLTYDDQGSEMAQHATFSANTGIKVYFADAHSPWQKKGRREYQWLVKTVLCAKGANLSKSTRKTSSMRLPRKLIIDRARVLGDGILQMRLGDKGY